MYIVKYSNVNKYKYEYTATLKHQHKLVLTLFSSSHFSLALTDSSDANPDSLHFWSLESSTLEEQRQ